MSQAGNHYGAFLPLGHSPAWDSARVRGAIARHDVTCSVVLTSPLTSMQTAYGERGAERVSLATSLVTASRSDFLMLYSRPRAWYCAITLWTEGKSTNHTMQIKGCASIYAETKIMHVKCICILMPPFPFTGIQTSWHNTLPSTLTKRLN